MNMQIVEKQIVELKGADYNPRKISQHDLEALKKSMAEFKCVEPVVVNKDGTIIGGHQRVRVALELGWSTIPCIFLDIPKVKEKTLNLALNRIRGEWDEERLAIVIEDLKLNDGNGDLKLTGFKEIEIGTVIDKFRESPEENFNPDDVLRKKPKSKRGEIYQLGRHRLMCGDATSRDDVEKLMDGKRADMVFTDPPYGVNYETEGRNPRWRKDNKSIANDNLGIDQEKFWLKGFSNLMVNGDIYICSAPGPSMQIMANAAIKAGIEHHQWVIWVKDQLCLGRSHYHYRHEHLFYGWKGKSSWNKSRTEDSVWEIKRPSKSPDHPTQKPIPLMVKAIKNSSRHQDIIKDLFGGSGSTLIACEQTDRICHMMEIEPIYCDVIRERYKKYIAENRLK